MPIVWTRKGGVQSGFDIGRYMLRRDGMGWIRRRDVIRRIR